MQEYFLPGRSHGVKDISTEAGQIRAITFYPSARSDGLLSIEDRDQKLVERFVHREDGLLYRGSRYSTDNVPFCVHDENDEDRRLTAKEGRVRPR